MSRTYDTKPLLGTIRIVPGVPPEQPRVIYEGSITNIVDGTPLQAFEHDITDELAPDERAHVDAIVARAQAWLGGK